MASRTRMAPTRVQLRPQSSSTATTNNTTTEMDENGFVKCTGHGRRCSRLVAGPATKNPGRAFYTCPLGREDPKRCKFFKWEDELQSTAQRPPHGGRTLGESPRVSHAERTTTMITPSKSGRTPVQPPKATETIDEIDWDKVDTDELEHQAILSTPGSSQRASGSGSQDTPARERLRAAVEEGVSGSKRGAQDTPSRERLRAAVEEGVSKRKREDDDQTPKRARVDTENPFLNTPQTPRSPSHPVLSPALASLGEVSEHIDRQERLIRASDQMKQGLRKTISNLQEKNTALEARVRELEAKLAAR